MYTESLDPGYETMTEAYDSGERKIGNAYAYTNATDSAGSRLH